MSDKKSIATIASRNRVVSNIINAFTHRDRFIVVGHRSPDADCFAGMVAIGLILSKLGKDVEICTVPDIPDQFFYLVQIARYNSIGVNLGCGELRGHQSADTVVFCDTPKLELAYRSAEVEALLESEEVRRIEFDHHVESDSSYCGDPGFCMVGDVSSSCELIGLLACKLSGRRSLLSSYGIEEVFSRNLVLSILTGMVDDTQLGSYVGGHRAKRFYNMFSSSFESMLRDKTTKSTNFGSMEQVFSELQHLSAKEARCHRYFLEKSRIEGPVGVVALNEAESEYSVEDFGLDTMVSVARGVADELAEQSQHVSLVAFFDPPEESDLIQFRARRSRSFQEIDLRDLLAVLKIDNGGGHAGAVGFRVSRDGVHDFTGLIERIIRTVRDLVDRSKAV